MAVNLSKNGTELMAAYKEVVDGKSDTNWVLFTYEGNSNDIRLAEKGDGGLEEMVEELSSGKVMYAFCRVQDPNSGLPKYVLINWTGEGVKDSRKGMCANHVSSMANFLKGAHVTVNARAEDDVEPDAILEKVSKASGASFHFHKQTPEYRDAPRGPVGSVYQKINAVEEIQQTNKDDFWSQAQRDEEVRRREESKRAEEERRAVERERREMDERQAKERERRAKERAQQIEEERIRQRQRDEEEREREQQRQENETNQSGISFRSSGSGYRKINAVEEIQQTNKDDFWSQAQRDEEVRRREESKRAEEERRAVERERREMDERQAKERERRAKERAQQIEEERIRQRQRDEEEREREQQRQNQQEHETKRTGIRSAASVQKANEAKSLISQRSFNPRDVFKQREQSIETNDRSSPAVSRPGKLQSRFLSQRSFEEQPQHPPAPAASITPLSPASPVLSRSPAAAVSPTPPETSGSPVQAADSAYTEEEEWSDEFDDDGDEATAEEPPAEEDLYEAQQAAGMEEGLYEDVYQDTFTAEDNYTGSSGQDIRARALYDYQAADDTEITFDPGDIITGIDMLDEGWWRGTGPDGHFGMFPANYVELL
ncbi:drebrin-like protein isoform X2 [Sparus aurata]|uniref:drebrin-like protein isoform X2 n=1 Tax=Sparus aurata TaxID=8175 RepID=UPI0011C1A43B|nr:drebrin-like protein isoform X2 [Sparus aurata]